MMRALFTGESGIKCHQTRMDVIGNNIANVNTVGYKSSRATFEDMLSQTLKGAAPSTGRIGSTNPEQVGLGTQIASTDIKFKDGAAVVTGKNTDLSLSGDGLFVVRNGNGTYYTRDGAFDFDGEGNYVLPGSGFFVQGWMAKDGVIDSTSGTENIRIPIGKPLLETTTGPTITGISTTAEHLNVSFGGKGFKIISIPSEGKPWKFRKDVPLGAKTAEIVNAAGESKMVTLSPVANFEVPKGWDVSVSDILILTKGSVTEQYPLTVSINGQQYKAIAMDKDMSHASASDWSLKSGGTAGSNTITVTNGTDDVTLTLASPLQEAIGQTRVTQAVASKDHPVTLMFSDGTTAVKTDGTYEVGTSIPVTTTVGMLQKVLIDSTGTITGVYSNGTRRTEAQVAVAHFNNSPGLFKTGTSLYQESADSGIPTMIQAGEYGVTITPGTLETSNVDLADEFSNMIVTQRGFQSNAKIITVGDEMIETAINTKR